MPDHHAAAAASSSSTPTKERKDDHGRQRIGNYAVGKEIGRGSFATVYAGHRLRTNEAVAIKAVSRQKLTAKLLENLESEINILKAISHRNIVSLEDCFKNDTHIYLVMEFCTGSDLSFYIKNRGRLATLEFEPRPGMHFSGVLPPAPGTNKYYWPHPPSGGIDERVTRCFLGQLAQALRFLRSENLIHRDIKPQNLLLQPASAAEIADGHPLGIPILKVADFGFARILPAAAMAETLCGSPLYMAPEILRYEKYDATADLWSVGAVLFEMAVGKPPFRANNHVELLRRIEKGEDRIKFPDESSSRAAEAAAEGARPPVPVSPDIKQLIRSLLKRRPQDRMGFEAFFACGVWDGYMTESSEGSLSLDASTDDSGVMSGSRSKVQDLVQSKREERATEDAGLRRFAPQPISADPALNPQPAVPALPRINTATAPSTQAVTPVSATGSPVCRVATTRRSEPKYYVSDDRPTDPAETLSRPTSTQDAVRTEPKPIATSQRRLSRRDDPASVEDPAPLTPAERPPPFAQRSSRTGEGSPLASAPPITMAGVQTGKDASALENSDSVVGREYVLVEKQTVEVNALADELEQASRQNALLNRRPSSRVSVVSRPVSGFRPAATPTPGHPSSAERTATAAQPMSYSPPFAAPSSSPPFASPAVTRQHSQSISRRSSIPQQMNTFPPSIPAYSPDSAMRLGVSPSSLQTGALARALASTAMRAINQGATQAATVLARAAARPRPSVVRSSSHPIDPAEDGLLTSLEELARKAFVLFELADAQCATWQALARNSSAGLLGSTPPFAQRAGRRTSSGSSNSSEVMILRQQEVAAGEATVLYVKALGYIVKGHQKIQRYWEERGSDYAASPELNEMVQWLRARFNECYEKADWAKQRCADELPFVDRLLHEKAKATSRVAAMAEMGGDLPTAGEGYDQSIWMLEVLLDDIVHGDTQAREDDRASIEMMLNAVKSRYTALKRKLNAEGISTPALS